MHRSTEELPSRGTAL